MATPRSRYIRVSDLVLDEPWSNDVAATFLRLLAWMRQRWAREHLSPKQACEAVIGGADAMRITGCSRPHIALERLSRWPLEAGLSAARASLESVKGVSSVRLVWPKVSEFQGWDTRESGHAKPLKSPLRRPVSRRPSKKDAAAPVEPESDRTSLGLLPIHECPKPDKLAALVAIKPNGAEYTPRQVAAWYAMTMPVIRAGDSKRPEMSVVNWWRRAKRAEVEAAVSWVQSDLIRKRQAEEADAPPPSFTAEQQAQMEGMFRG